MRVACLLIPMLALSACGKADNETGPGGVTVGEARALDEAAAMLDNRRPPPAVLQPTIQAVPEADATSAPVP